MRVVSLLLFGAALCLALGCRRPEGASSAGGAAADGPVWFRDATAEVGLDFIQDAGAIGHYFMPQIMGSGAALLDLDNDGRFDLYFVHNGGPDSASRNRLFHQTKEGRFEDVSAGSGLDIAGHGMGVTIGDFDNDGWVDVYVSQYGGGRLFRNRGNGKFEDVTQNAGVAQPSWGTSCCFVDYDRDGWLDLVVVNYVEYDPGFECGPASGKHDYCHPRVFPGTAMRLFHNRGSDKSGSWGGYVDVTESAGVAKRSSGLGVACADFNGDGWPDIFVANDARPNHLWINRRDGTFAEEALARGVAYNGLGQAPANMGVTLGKIDSNDRLSVFVTHLTEETHTLWQQSERGFFQDRTVAAGIAASDWRGTGFGTLLADFDLDGATDLAIVNGRVSRSRGELPAVRSIDSYWLPYVERNQLFQGDGQGHFHDISRSEKNFCGSYAIGRGLVWGDFDDDGRLDLVVTYIAGPARFYRNVAPRRGHWLIVRAFDPALRRDAYGAVVTIQAGSRRWIGFVNPGQSYQSSGDPRVHFGLGSVEHVDSIHIDWPDGQAEVFPPTKVDRVVRLEHGQGQRANGANKSE